MRIRSGPAKRAGLASSALMVALALTACSGGDDGDDGDAESPSPTESPVTVQHKVAVGEVTGRLAPARRDEVTAEVGEIVTTWVEASYFDGAPDIEVAGAFPGFTKGAAQLARRDRWLMSNASLPAGVEEVLPVGKVTVLVDILAARQRAAGATARFEMVFDVVAAKTRRVHVRGRVVLTRTDKGDWTIFGYDAGRWDRTLKGERS